MIPSKDIKKIQRLCLPFLVDLLGMLNGPGDALVAEIRAVRLGLLDVEKRKLIQFLPLAANLG